MAPRDSGAMVLRNRTYKSYKTYGFLEYDL